MYELFLADLYEFFFEVAQPGISRIADSIRIMRVMALQFTFFIRLR